MNPSRKTPCTSMRHKKFEDANVANTMEHERFELQNVANTVDMAASSFQIGKIARIIRRKTDQENTPERKNNNSQNNSGPLF